MFVLEMRAGLVLLLQNDTERVLLKYMFDMIKWWVYFCFCSLLLRLQQQLNPYYFVKFVWKYVTSLSNIPWSYIFRLSVNP